MTNQANNLKAYVDLVLDSVRIRIIDTSMKEIVCGYNDSDYDMPDESSVVYYTKNNTEIAGLFRYLRDSGVCFSHGREWNPSEIFEDLREKEMLDGKYLLVYWTGKGKYHIEER